MLFSKLSTAVLAFASVASSIPLSHNALAAREASVVERGLVWTPRQLQTRNDRDRNGDKTDDRNRNRNKKNIIIAQNVNVQLTRIQIIQEVQIVNIIQNIIVVVGLDVARDNIRKNHYRNRNQNKDVNIIIIVVVVVVDAQDDNNRNVRYMTRQLESNPEGQTKQWVVVTEQNTLTVDSQIATATTGIGSTEITSAPEAFATGDATPSIAVYDPAAPLALGSGERTLLPAGIGAPSWPQASHEQDPAIIIEVNQVVIVVFGNDNNDNHDNNRNYNKQDNKNDDQKDNKNNDNEDNNKDEKKGEEKKA